jgi:hypothetical protein
MFDPPGLAGVGFSTQIVDEHASVLFPISDEDDVSLWTEVWLQDQRLPALPASHTRWTLAALIYFTNCPLPPTLPNTVQVRLIAFVVRYDSCI